MKDTYKYEFQYEHLQDEYVKDSRSRFVFNAIRDNANKQRLELTDEEFKYFVLLKSRDVDIGWIMNVMRVYDKDMLGALVTYVSF